MDIAWNPPVVDGSTLVFHLDSRFMCGFPGRPTITTLAGPDPFAPGLLPPRFCFSLAPVGYCSWTALSAVGHRAYQWFTRTRNPFSKTMRRVDTNPTRWVGLAAGMREEHSNSHQPSAIPEPSALALVLRLGRSGWRRAGAGAPGRGRPQDETPVPQPHGRAGWGEAAPARPLSRLASGGAVGVNRAPHPVTQGL